jgi:hypothetical protein
VLWKIGTFTAGAGEPVQFLFPLENFSAQTKSFGAGCRIEPGANAGGGPARLRIHVAQREDVAMKYSDFTPSPQPFELDLDDLLHPAQAFAHPRDVVADGDLTVNEKRAVLASWASDACAVEAAPALRHAPGAAAAVSVDEILEALRSLDREANDAAGRTMRGSREARRRAFEAFRLRCGPPGSESGLSR